MQEYTFLSPIENYTPGLSVILDEPGESAVLEVFTLAPTFYEMEYQWYIDDSLIIGEDKSDFLVDDRWGLDLLK